MFAYTQTTKIKLTKHPESSSGQVMTNKNKKLNL